MSTVMWIIQVAYFIAAILFIVGLKGMSSPKRARRGFITAGVGMAIAVVVTFFLPGVGGATNIILILIALGLGGPVSWIAGKRVPITAMPQMVALYNGMGGGAAAAIAAHALTTGEAWYARSGARRGWGPDRRNILFRQFARLRQTCRAG